MCIVIDTNTFASVFDSKSTNHSEFKDVLTWIVEGKGTLVFGGSKYKKEIPPKYLPFFSELNKRRKTCKVPDIDVDKEEIVVSGLIQHPDFDDPHLVAILRLSGCKLICSLDERAYPFFHHELFFKPARVRPKIYCSSRNRDLLCDENIADFCKPAKVLNKNEKENLSI